MFPLGYLPLGFFPLGYWPGPAPGVGLGVLAIVTKGPGGLG